MLCDNRCGIINIKCSSHPQLDDVSKYEVGQELKVEELFDVGDLVDVAGTSTGKGFQGRNQPCRGVELGDARCVVVAGQVNNVLLYRNQEHKETRHIHVYHQHICTTTQVPSSDGVMHEV